MHSKTLELMDDYWKGHFTAMASPCEVLIETENRKIAQQALDIAASEAWRIEEKFSRYKNGNIIDKINKSNGKTIEVDPETAGLLDFAKQLYEISEGLFDISSGVLRKTWHFDGSDKIPSQEQVDDILKYIGWSKIDWAPPHLTLQPNMQIDFGGIGKEYAVDRAAHLIAENLSDHCLINFGGDLFATGPRTDNKPWQVGIENVSHSQQSSTTFIELSYGGLATSGDARRYLLKNGVRYSHVLNPQTGWPITNAPHSITVAANTCTEAGMLATLAMLQGENAEAFLENEKLTFWCFR